MSTCVRVHSGVAIWGVITTKRHTTCLTRAQVDPAGATFDALLAFPTRRALDLGNCLDVNNYFQPSSSSIRPALDVQTTPQLNLPRRLTLLVSHSHYGYLRQRTHRVNWFRGGMAPE